MQKAFTQADAVELRCQFGHRFKAFTLAEVLITLAIIGIVAAMTIPTLIQNYQEKVTVTKVKKIYSTLSNAYQLYLIDNQPEVFDYTKEGAQQVYKIFEPYLKVAKDCGNNNEGECISKDFYNSEKYYKAILADGSTLIFRGGNGDDFNLEVFFDVNGKNPPDKWGYDIFEFDALGYRFLPCGTPGTSISFEEHCKNLLSAPTTGYGCAAWVINWSNLDYTRCSDLEWNGKHKCD